MDNFRWGFFCANLYIALLRTPVRRRFIVIIVGKYLEKQHQHPRWSHFADFDIHHRFITYAHSMVALDMFSAAFVFVCLLVFPRDIANDAAKVTVLNIWMFYRESCKDVYFGIKRSGHKAQKHCWRGSRRGCECWLPVRHKCKKQQFIHTVNGDGSKTAKSQKGNVNHTNIAWMSMLVFLTLPFYDFLLLSIRRR